MSDSMISPSDAALVIHRLVTESVPVLAWFVSSDKLVRSKIDGFVTSFVRDPGLVISTESALVTPDTAMPGFITFAHDFVIASSFKYSDDTQVPAEFVVGSGLRINFPDGATLTIMEKCPIKS